MVLAEDPQHTRKILNFYGAQAELIRFNQHDEQAKQNQVLAMLQAGKTVALVSDAGTPLVNDPGYQLVHAVQTLGFTVSLVLRPLCVGCSPGAFRVPNRCF